ncbi:TonB-dependent receptor [Pseudoalteromonas sp. PAR1]|uniref:TonB-dependent receptor n=1 Tax=Pseudoalteromonas sp. PAR1 TaxID=2853443 RepID=UPI00248D23CD|nr:TonB-dependent receptor [Pseudoalteromonas sp. PAR1]
MKYIFKLIFQIRYIVLAFISYVSFVEVTFAKELLKFDIPQLSANLSLRHYAIQSGRQVIIPRAELESYTLNSLLGFYSAEDALLKLIEGSPITVSVGSSGLLIVSVNDKKRDLHSTNSSDLKKVKSPTLGNAVSASKDTSVERIIVTARKKSETLSEIPIALKVFGSAQLDEIGARKFSDFLELTPGVALLDSGSLLQLSVRGVSTSLGGNANGYYLNNVPFTGITVPWNPYVQTFDIKRVEVLRGPQGTLFGDGAMGGTVRILTNDADPVEFYGRIDSQYSSISEGENSKSFRGMINIPLVQDLAALRVVAIEEKQGGWIDIIEGDNNYNRINSSTHRVHFIISPSEKMNMKASYWSNARVGFGSNRALDDSTIQLADSVSEQGYEQFSASFDYEFDSVNFSYAYGKNELYYDVVTDIPGLGLLDAGIEIKVETHELLFTNNTDGDLDWTFGYYYRDGKREDETFIESYTDTVSPSRSEAQAIFGEVEYHLNKDWRLALGARYFEEDLKVSESGIDISGPFETSYEDEFSQVSPRLIISYEPNDNWLVYASGAQGFRGGQAQPTSSISLANELGIDLPESIDSDTITTYELGSKSTLLDGSLVLEAAAYYSDWEDVPVRFEIISGALNGIYQSEGITIAGLELALSARLSKNLTMNGGLSLMDPKYSEDVPGSSINKGDKPTNISDVSANLSFTYRQHAFQDYDWFGYISGQYFSEREDTSYATYQAGDDITLMNMRVGLDNYRYGVYVFVNNLTDEDGAIGPRSPDIGIRPQPRTVGIEMKFTF